MSKLVYYFLRQIQFIFAAVNHRDGNFIKSLKLGNASCKKNHAFFVYDRCKDQNIHREFKHQSGVGLVVYNEELANLICLVSFTVSDLYFVVMSWLRSVPFHRNYNFTLKFFIAPNRVVLDPS